MLLGELFPKLLLLDLILEYPPIPHLLVRVLRANAPTSRLGIVDHLAVDLDHVRLVGGGRVRVGEDSRETMLQILEELQIVRVLLGVVVHAVDDREVVLSVFRRVEAL